MVGSVGGARDGVGRENGRLFRTLLQLRGPIFISPHSLAFFDVKHHERLRRELRPRCEHEPRKEELDAAACIEDWWGGKRDGSRRDARAQMKSRKERWGNQ